MTEPREIDTVAEDEELARFVLRKDWIRKDQTLKADAFLPFPHARLSVTRHRGITKAAFWDQGMNVARARGTPLLGSGDFLCGVAVGQGLKVRADPLSDNLSHASVDGWPPDKEAQRMIALEIAATARFTSAPQRD